MTGAVTPWISVATPPLADRPGWYDVMFAYWPHGVTVRMRWDGSRWETNGEHTPREYYPREAWGDRWRGLAAPAQD